MVKIVDKGFYVEIYKIGLV